MENVKVPRYLLYYSLPKDRNRINLRGIVPKAPRDFAFFKPIQGDITNTLNAGVPTTFCVCFGDNVDAYDLRELPKLHDFPTYMINDMDEDEVEAIEYEFMQKYFPDHHETLEKIRRNYAEEKRRDDEDDYVRSRYQRGQDVAADLGIQPVSDEKAELDKKRARDAKTRKEAIDRVKEKFADDFDDFFAAQLVKKKNFDVWLIDTQGLKAEWNSIGEDQLTRGDQVYTTARIAPYYLDLVVKAGQASFAHIKESAGYHPEGVILHALFEHLVDANESLQKKQKELFHKYRRSTCPKGQETYLKMIFTSREKNLEHHPYAFLSTAGRLTPWGADFNMYFTQYPDVDKGHRKYEELFQRIFIDRNSLHVAIELPTGLKSRSKGWCWLEYWYGGEELTCLGIRSNPSSLDADDFVTYQTSIGSLATAVQMLKNPVAQGDVFNIKQELIEWASKLPPFKLDLNDIRGHLLSKDLGI